MTNNKEAVKIASWNVNSVRVRMPVLSDWLQEASPDIVLLQELKCVDEAFPHDQISDLGYNVAVLGQKTYNGVAILAKQPIEDVTKGLGEDENQAYHGQARYIEAVVGNVRVASVYVPNGQTLTSDAYQYKLRFMEKLKQRLKYLLQYEEKVIIGGDFNIAPEDIDVYDPKEWEGEVLCSIPERQAWNALLHLGYSDAFRAINNGQVFSWWDYRGNNFNANRGLRIDHFLLSPQAADCLEGCYIDQGPRVVEKTSDHAPIICQVF